MRTRQWLAAALVVLAAGLAANSALGPLWLETIQYRYSETMLNQAIGLDAVSLFAAAPLALTAAWLVQRGRGVGPALALGPAAYAMYMMPQYVIGPEYGVIDGNNERFFALHFGLFIAAASVFVLGWSALTLAPDRITGVRRRAAVGFLLGFPAFLVVGLYSASLPDALSGSPTRDAYVDNPTAFWIVAFLDLAVVAPAAFAGGLGLLLGAKWSARAVMAVVGWFALVPPSVAAMSLVMVANDDPHASTGGAVAFGGFAVVFAVFAAWFYWPFLGARHTTRVRRSSGALPMPRP